jgi:UDP-N-acetylglucosamine 4,6-dehydratase
MTRFWLTLDQGVRFVVRCIDQMYGGEVFVPKIPSMKITDLAQAMAPQSEIEYIGIRSGEKIHEVLLSEDEARHATELDGMYVIKPDHPWWCGANWSAGSPLAEGFRYTSDENPDWLSKQELKSLSGDHDTEYIHTSDSRWPAGANGLAALRASAD